MNKNYQTLGFTLIELSIVLVIIGLLVSGVLVGQTLIKAADARALVKQIGNLETQINAFRGKFDCLPGDCLNATSFLGTTDSTGYALANGDGDYLIRSVSGSDGITPAPDCLESLGNDEPNQLFAQLGASNIGVYPKRAAGYIPHAPDISSRPDARIIVTCLTSTAHPSAYLNNFFGIGTNIMTLGGVPHTRLIYTLGGISGNPARYGMDSLTVKNVDVKIDDGLQNRGVMGVVSSHPNNTSTCVTGTSNYPDIAGCLIVAGKKLK